jgi:hypothetical protein
MLPAQALSFLWLLKLQELRQALYGLSGDRQTPGLGA